jgi:hypothetical protein
MPTAAATPIEIFRAGTHTAASGRSVTITAADLAAIAAGYDPATHEAPIVVGHPETDAPAYGWVRGLSVEGGRLQADVADIDPAFAELVRARRFSKISASFYDPDSPANPKPGQWSLKHVGFLGAAPPAVKGLKQVAFNAAETGVETFAEAWSLGLVARLFGSLRDMLIGQFGQEAADRALPRDAIDTIATAEPPLPPPATSFTDPTPPKETPMPEDTAAALAAVEAERKKLREEQAAFAEAQRVHRRAQDEAFTTELVKQGRLPKALAATAATLLARAPDGEAVSFAEGAAAETDRAALRRLLAAMPVIVEFREIAGGDDLPPPDRRTPADITRAAEALIAAEKAKGREVSFVEATAIVTKESAQ